VGRMEEQSHGPTHLREVTFEGYDWSMGNVEHDPTSSELVEEAVLHLSRCRRCVRVSDALTT